MYCVEIYEYWRLSFQHEALVVLAELRFAWISAKMANTNRIV